MTAEEIAKEFHIVYEQMAPKFGYETRKETSVPWESVPLQNKRLMTAVVQDLLDRRIIYDRRENERAKTGN